MKWKEIDDVSSFFFRIFLVEGYQLFYKIFCGYIKDIRNVDRRKWKVIYMSPNFLKS